VPELPEVETIRQDLRKKILSKTIKKVGTTAKARLNLSSAKFVRSLQGQKFLEINRIGKLLIFVLPKNNYLLVHLKMSGQLIYQRGREVIAGGHSDNKLSKLLPDNFTRAVFSFVDGSKLFFNDMRRFGYLKIVGENELKNEKAKFGIEPLTKNFTLKNFKATLQGRKTNLKALLLNQKLFAGIGNIYADESCFVAGIRPDIQINKLIDAQIKRLFVTIQTTMKQAIKKRGTTFNSFVDADGNRGNFVASLKVYGRGGQKCRRCGDTLLRVKIAGRRTVYCPNCQK